MLLAEVAIQCRALREGAEWDRLSEARKRIVESELRDFVLGGVALEVGGTPLGLHCHPGQGT